MNQWHASRTRRAGATSTVCLLAAFLSLGLFGLSKTSAQTSLCEPAEIGFGQCFNSAVSHFGVFGFAATGIIVDPADSTTDTLGVLDLFSGTLYRYDVNNFGLDEPDTITSPMGTGLHSGIAAKEDGDNDRLFWLFDASGTGAPGQQEIIVTDVPAPGSSNAMVVDMFPIESPAGGFVGDITYDALADTLWAIDVDNDVFFQVSADPTAPLPSPISFDSPGIVFGARIAFGLSIEAIPAVDEMGMPTTHLDVVYGFPSDAKAARVRRLRTDGSQIGLEYNLLEALSQFEWPAGIAYLREAGPASEEEEVVYVVDAVDNRIFEVPVVPPAAARPFDFTCEADDFNNVTLNWTNPGVDIYTTISILRNGNFLAGLTANAQSFTDMGAPEGLVEYQLEITPAAGGAAQETTICEVVVGLGRLGTNVDYDGTEPFAVTVVEDETLGLDYVYVADLVGGTIQRYEKDLTLPPLAPLASPFGDVAGLAWNPDSDRLLWFFPPDMLVETDFDGANPGSAVTLTSPFGASNLIGDITYADGSYWAVDVTSNRYFEFSLDGSSTAQIGENFSFPNSNGLSRGISSVEGQLVFDLPVGSNSSEVVDRVVRVTPINPTPEQEIDLVATTRSGKINGLAYTSTGSNGGEALYIAAGDIGHVFELRLSSLGLPFIRGDADQNGQYDVVDATLTLLFLFMGQSVSCERALDATDDEVVDIADVLFTLDYLFAGGPAPLIPFGECDFDMTVEMGQQPLSCDDFDCP